MSIYEDCGVPTGVVPKLIPMEEDKSNIIPLMEPSTMTIGNINPHNTLPHQPMTPNVPYQPSVIITDDIKKQIADSYEKNKEEKHKHYRKDVSKFKTIDIYRILDLYYVTDPCIQHAIKKLLVAGGRGAGKSIEKDIDEAIDSLQRWIEMKKENDAKL